MASRRRRLAQRRRSAGLSQEELAARLSVERSTVARWEAGLTEPLPWIRPKLARLLHVSADQLSEFLYEPDGNEGGPSERLRHALTHPGATDLVAVAQLREQTHELEVRYDGAPSAPLLAEAGQCLGQVTFLRTQAPADARVQHELHMAQAEAATLMGQLVWDASQRRDHATARLYFGQAIDAARALRDPAAEGVALLRSCFLALYGEQNPCGGLALATRTSEVASGVSDVLIGLAVLHAAEAHAMLGQRRDCERALGEAESHLAQCRPSDPAAGWFSPAHHGRLAGSCYLFLGDPARAEPILRQTAQSLSGKPKTRAIVLGNLALARIRQGKLEEAAAALYETIDIVEKTRGGGGLNIAFSAGRELGPWRSTAAVQDVYDRLLALMTA